MRNQIIGLAFLTTAFALNAGGQTATTTTLAVSSEALPLFTTVNPGTVVTLTATVNAGSTPVTTGQVNFCDATASYCTDIHLLGTAQLTSAGTATREFRPGVGNHSYKAVFLGTPKGTLNATASTSGAVALQVSLPGGYSTETTIAQSGSPGSYTLTATVSGTGTTTPTGTITFIDISNNAIAHEGSNEPLTTVTLAPVAGGLSSITSSSLTTVSFPSAVAVADFNGDGILDLAVTNAGSNNVNVMLGKGDGTFTTMATSPATGPDPSFIVSGDFNGDGIPDLAISNWDTISNSNTVTILLGSGDGTFTTAATIPAPGTGTPFIVSGDFNRDGILDLAVLNQSGTAITILLGNGNGTFTATATSPQTGATPVSIGVGDFNGDGILDLAVVNQGSNTVTILSGNGDGTFTPTATPTPGSQATGVYPVSVTTGDFNQDGKLDLCLGNDDGSVTVLLGNGDGTFTPPANSPLVAEDAFSIQVGDFNGDGIPDLAVASGYPGGDSASYAVTILLGDGKGNFPTTVTLGQPSTPEYNISPIAVGDFNGDGIPDVAGATYLDVSGVSAADATGPLVAFLMKEGQSSTASSSRIVLPEATGANQVIASYYPGLSSSYNSSISDAITLYAVQGTPTVTVTASPSPAIYGTSVTLTASVTALLYYGPGLTATGTVQFSDGGNLVGTATLNSNGIATYTTSTLPAGQNSISANYGGNADYDTATSPAVIVSVNGALTPTVIVTPSATSVTTLQSLPVTVTVNGIAGNPTPTGSVTLTSGSYASGATGLSSGTASISIPAGSLALGTNNITASYAGDMNYAPAASSAVSVSVAKTTPTITWSTPAAIPYGTAVSATQLDATASVAGSFSYSPLLGTVLTAGSQTLTANFTPTDVADYTTATASVTLMVNQATPMVTWATPAAIVSGTALSAAQLDATASVPGTFVYTPALGATPPVGNDTLSVTFTPTDNIDYSAVTASVTLTVNVPPNPLPFLGNITPAIANAGGADFTITANGSGFLSNSTVYWGTSALTTVFVSSTQLTATVTAADIATPGATAINVQTPAPGGGTSDILQFEVDSPAAAATAPAVPTAVVSVTAGSTATYSISFPASVTNATASCLNLPTGALCSFSFASGILTISTSSSTPAGTYQVTVVFDETVSGSSSGFILLPLLLLPLYFLRRKMTARGMWSAVGLSLILVGAMVFSVGCGGSSSSTTTTQTTQSVTSSGVVGMKVQ